MGAKSDRCWTEDELYSTSPKKKAREFRGVFLVGGGDSNLLFGVGNSHETDRMEMCVEAQKSWVEKPLNLFLLPLCIDLSLQYLQQVPVTGVRSCRFK